MATKQVAKLWGMDFSVVPEGLARDEVVAYVDDLKSELQTTGPKGAQQSSLVKLAEQTVIEAHKLAEEVLEQAHTDAEAEAARIRKAAEEQARQQVQHILEAGQAESGAKSDALIAKAEQQAQQILKRARRTAQDGLQSAQQKADDIRSEAELEAEFALRKLMARVTGEIGEAVTAICNKVLPAVKESAWTPVNESASGNGKVAAVAVAATRRVKAKPSPKNRKN